jgi:hypothetical protein
VQDTAYSVLQTLRLSLRTVLQVKNGIVRRHPMDTSPLHAVGDAVGMLLRSEIPLMAAKTSSSDRRIVMRQSLFAVALAGRAS